MADEPKIAVTELIPSVQHGVSGVGSAHAPIIFIDEFPRSGFYNGIAHITCETIRFHSGPNDTVITDKVVVAHLRMNFPALVALKGAIAVIEDLIAKHGEKLPSPPPLKKPA